MKRLLLTIIVWLSFSTISVAQVNDRFYAAVGEISPVSTRVQPSVSELSHAGRHYEALLRFGSIPKDKHSIADRNSAARSSWALGLVDHARGQWDELLQNKEFVGVERSRAFLARSILELQENNYEPARAIAERGSDELQSSELRSQFWLLIGEALREQGVLSHAEDYYKRASMEGNGQTKSEALYHLGETQRELGMLREARYSYTSIPLASSYAPLALRRLMEIDFIERDYDGVLTWLDEGSSAHPTEFDKPWDYYAKISAFIEQGRLDKATSLLRTFGLRHSVNNQWYALADAAIESKQVEQLYLGKKVAAASSVSEDDVE